MIQNKEITHSEFEKSCKLFGYETFSDKQVETYIQDAKLLIEKSEKEELNDIEKSQLDEFNVNCASLKQINVVNDDLTKSLIYFRPAQVIWDKDENGEIMKSRAGTYADTPQNKKLGRVGQKFGGQKQEEGKKEGGDIEGAKKQIAILAGEKGIGDFKEDGGMVKTLSQKFNLSPEKTVSLLKEHGGKVVENKEGEK